MKPDPARAVATRREHTVRMVACATIAFALLAAASEMAELRRSDYGRPVDYLPGQRLDVAPEVYATGRMSLLLFTRHNCGACQSAKPWLGNLVARVRERWHDVEVTLIARSADAAREREFGGDIGLPPERVMLLSGRLRLRSVPTVMVVDREGTIVFAHTGTPDGDRDTVTRAILASLAVRPD